MTIRTAITQGTELLAGALVGEPRLTAEVLLAHAIQCERTHFYAHPEQELREVEWLHYGRYLHERMQGNPPSTSPIGRSFMVARFTSRRTY